MKLLNLTAALFLGGVLQAQNPLPAIHPQPQEVTLSTNRLKAPSWLYPFPACNIRMKMPCA